jgi:hypothetical protein
MTKKIENVQQTKWKGIVTIKKPQNLSKEKKNNEKVYPQKDSNKTNFEKIRKYLKKRGITSVWHFTDRSNLTSILKYGILSLKKIKQKNIMLEHTGADTLSHSLDKYKGLDQYIHLSFIKDHPMYHIAKSRQSIIDPVWLEIDISVLFEKNTLFCDKVANDSTAKLFKIDKIKKKIDFDTMLFSLIFDEYKEARKAEILVLDHISSDKILGVYNGK